MAIGEGTKKVWLKAVKKCARISGGASICKKNINISKSGSKNIVPTAYIYGRIFFRKETDNMNGNYFLLPNSIFDEGLTPMEFTVYGFLTSRGDAKGQSFYSVPNIAKACGMCENSCRKAIRNLSEKGLIDVSERYFDNARQSNLYTVLKL